MQYLEGALSVPRNCCVSLLPFPRLLKWLINIYKDFNLDQNLGECEFFLFAVQAMEAERTSHPTGCKPFNKGGFSAPCSQASGLCSGQGWARLEQQEKNNTRAAVRVLGRPGLALGRSGLWCHSRCAFLCVRMSVQRLLGMLADCGFPFLMSMKQYITLIRWMCPAGDYSWHLRESGNMRTNRSEIKWNVLCKLQKPPASHYCRKRTRNEAAFGTLLP